LLEQRRTFAAMDAPLPEHGLHLMRRLRVVRRFLSLLLWTLMAMPILALCLMLPGPPKVAFARFYWVLFSRLLGVQVQVIGNPVSHQAARPVLFVSNHSSWVDVPVVGGVVDGCFVAKGEIERWPLVNLIAWLGRTVFVTRRRGATGRERDAMRGRLAAGDNLILFPEGTSSDGSRVLPFRSAFFAIADAPPGAQPPLIQPVSVAYDRLGSLPMGRARRPVFAWYGDMDLASHFWRLGQQSGLRATVLLHAPLDPVRYPDRKALAQAVWKIVADGAAALRQNRPATPAVATSPAVA
jgi:lyso-ornithine lipid O-acyltransferase